MTRRRPPRREPATARAPGEDRAVSETVGFVLVFALITTTIAVAFTLGVGGLNEAQLVERDNNVERAFDVLHHNARDVTRDGVPSRATEIRLAGGALFFDTDTQLTVTADGEQVIRESEAVGYRGDGDTRIRYEHGAVVRSDGSGSVVLAEPDLLFGDTTVLSVVDVRQRSDAVGGDRTVLVRTEAFGNRGIEAEADAVTVRIEGPTVDAWERYYERQQAAAAERGVDLTVDRNGDVLEVEIDPENRVVVHRTTVEVSFAD